MSNCCSSCVNRVVRKRLLLDILKRTIGETATHFLQNVFLNLSMYIMSHRKICGLFLLQIAQKRKVQSMQIFYTDCF